MASVGRPKKNQEKVEEKSSELYRPALSVEAEENQMIALAVNAARKQLLEGTASAQVITHYLKLGSTKERLEKKILQKQEALLDAKTKQIESSSHADEVYAAALAAFKTYSGNNDK